jgi:hypothetical protein
MSDADAHPDPELLSPDAGPRRATSLLSRRAPLVSPAAQLRALAEIDLTGAPVPSSFDDALIPAGWPEGLRPSQIEIFQINIGKLCNMTCRHCHVDAGPDRTDAMMDDATVDEVL